MHNPKVIISVLNWNNYRDTISCLKSLNELDYENYEVIFVDNNSTNNSITEIRNMFAEVNLIISPDNYGYAGGHKLALEYSIENNAELIWILNNDVTVRKDSLSALVERFKEKPDAIYGSITLCSECPDIVGFGGGLNKNSVEEFEYNRYKGIILSDYQNIAACREVQSLEGCSLLIPVNIIKDHGFMNTSYFMYGEETDYCYYLRSRGIPSIIVPESIVVHKTAGSLSNKNMSVISGYYRRRNHLLFRKKYYNWRNLDIIRKQGGIIALIKFFIKYWMFSGKDFKTKNKNLYFINLGTIHAILGIRGKTVKPEKFIKVS